MALGFKIKKVKLQNEYSLESLYEAIKGQSFTAGAPSYTKHGLAYVITFPALDSQNQVQILPGGMGKTTSSFQVLKAEQAGVTNMAGNAMLNKLTGGLFRMKSIAGKNAKEIERLVEVTAQELGSMGL